MARKNRKQEEELVLAPFYDACAIAGLETLAAFMKHCQIGIEPTQSPREAILAHYRVRDGSYDVDLVARDLLRWQPIADRIREIVDATSAN